MIGVIIAILLAALVYALCVALGLPAIVGIVAAILVLLAGIPERRLRPRQKVLAVPLSARGAGAASR
jgi:hypothetical protein